MTMGGGRGRRGTTVEGEGPSWGSRRGRTVRVLAGGLVQERFEFPEPNVGPHLHLRLHLRAEPLGHYGLVR